MAEFTHNNMLSSTMKETPFFTLMGYHPRSEWSLAKANLPQVKTRLAQCLEAWQSMQECMKQAQSLWIKYKDMPKYTIRDRVWLEGQHL